MLEISITQRNRSSVISFISFILLFLLSCTIHISEQQNYCPKACNCDEQNLEIVCKESIRAYGIPHTLNPSTKRIFINNGQTTQLTGLDYLVKLEYLDIAYNNLTSIYFAHISKNSELTFINASHNSISLLDHNPPSNLELDPLPEVNLIELDLSHNKLVQLRNGTFSRLQKLQRLDVSHNLISSIQDHSLDGLHQLQVLNLRFNRLMQVPSTSLKGTVNSPSFSFFHRTPQLRYLDLGLNLIQNIGPEAFRHIDGLQNLMLDNCLITSIHEQAFKSLANLIYLNLEANKLQQVPSASFEPLSSLKYLKISANNLTQLPSDSFEHLSRLEELQLNNCSIEEVSEGCFNGLYYLSKLEMMNNPNLTKIGKNTIGRLTRLTYLNFSSNYLQSIIDDGISSIETLQLIDLRNNKLQCECDMKWLTKWLIKTNGTLNNEIMTNHHSHHQTQIPSTLRAIQISNLNLESVADLLNLSCSGPPALAGSSIRDLPQNNLECLEPTSELNLNMGFGSLFLMISILGLISVVNYCHYQRHLFAILKESIVHHQYSESRSQNY